MSVRYPIAEIFDSVQGEGHWVGTWMRFVRFAGCPVGKGTGMCRAEPSGYEFPCDTDYGMKEMVTVDELVERCEGVDYICFTGGEPLAHDLAPVVKKLFVRKGGCWVHVETSGVGRYRGWLCLCWVTVSPKQGWNIRVLNEAEEFKWLVHHKYPFIDFSQRFKDAYHWVQPVWDERYRENLQYALDLCRQNQELRLSVQVHKLIGVK